MKYFDFAIYFHVIFGLLFISSVSYGEDYANCVALEPSYVIDNACKRKISGCTRYGTQVHKPGLYTIASCNPVACEGQYPERRCECPTDPNECANDQPSDGIGHYSSTEWITESPRAQVNKRKDMEYRSGRSGGTSN